MRRDDGKWENFEMRDGRRDYETDNEESKRGTE